MTTRQLLTSFLSDIKADIDDEGMDLDRESLLHIKDIVNSTIEQLIREQERKR